MSDIIADMLADMNIMPEPYIEELWALTPDNDPAALVRRYETVLFELLFGINKDNVQGVIEISKKLFRIRPNLKLIAEKFGRVTRWPTNSHIKYFTAFGIPCHRIDPEDQVYADNDSEKISAYVAAADVKGGLSEFKYYCIFKKAIEHEAIKIVRFIIMLKTDFSDYHIQELAEKAVRVGNLEIIRLFVQEFHFDFAKIKAKDLFDCHHFDVIDWVISYQNAAANPNSLSYTGSLYVHFVYGVPYQSYPEYYDISCIPPSEEILVYSKRDLVKKFFRIRAHEHLTAQLQSNEFQDISAEKIKDPTYLIMDACPNILIANEFNFKIEHLATAITERQVAIFEHILPKVTITTDEIGPSGLNIFQVAILSGNVVFLQRLIESSSFNKKMLFALDRTRNNVFHFAMKQDSPEIFNLLKSQFTPEEFSQLIDARNLRNDTPKSLNSRYSHGFI